MQIILAAVRSNPKAHIVPQLPLFLISNLPLEDGFPN